MAVPRTSRWLIVASCILLAAPLISRAQESRAGRRFYSISINNNVIGYNMIDRAEVEEDGKKLIRVDSELSMKYALLGQPKNTLGNSTTWLSAEDGRPVRYRGKLKSNAVEFMQTARVADGKVFGLHRRKADEEEEPKEIEVPADVCFLGSNNFAHWEALLKAASAQAGEKGEATVRVYLPEAVTATDFALKRGKEATVEVAGEKYDCQLWELKGAGIKVAVDKAGGTPRQDADSLAASGD